jgi:hypothetical protein
VGAAAHPKDLVIHRASKEGEDQGTCIRVDAQRFFDLLAVDNGGKARFSGCCRRLLLGKLPPSVQMVAGIGGQLETTGTALQL